MAYRSTWCQATAVVTCKPSTTVSRRRCCQHVAGVVLSTVVNRARPCHAAGVVNTSPVLSTVVNRVLRSEDVVHNRRQLC